MNKSNPSSAPTSLQAALERYRVALECLDRPKTSVSSEQALEILLARDDLQKALETEAQIPVAILPQLMQLDSCLKKQACRVTQACNLAKYRESLPKSSQEWWRNLEATGEPHPWNRLDYLWKVIRIVLWTGNLGLLGTLATRLFSGGSGIVEIAALAFPSILALLQAQSELTAFGQEGFNRLLARLKIPQHWHEEAKLGSTILLCLLLIIIWHLQPQIAKTFNQEGWKAQAQGQLTTAEQKYLRAIALEPENLDANYNLGNLYEELQDFDNARKYYLIAAKGGIPEAYNNLARLYIQAQQYSEAVILLQKGLDQIEQQEQKLDKKQDSLPEAKYSLFKNLGWARFMQTQNEEAQDYLNIAIGIASQPDNQAYIPNPGAAHCLLAQVLERQKQPKQGFVHWQQCRNLVEKRLAAGETINPEEDTWLILAKQKLSAASQGGSTP
jgi:tetratricopeptide (TPR) repeat protein